MVVELPKPLCTHARRFSIPAPTPTKGHQLMLKLHADVSKKVGLPGFSITWASCTIEAELDGALLNDTESIQMVVRRASVVRAGRTGRDRQAPTPRRREP
jgi:hypothetical protein